MKRILFYFSFSVLLLFSFCLPAQDADTILKLAEEGKAIELKNFEVLMPVRMPSSLQDFLNKLTIVTPQIITQADTKTILGGAIIDDISFEVKIRILSASGGKKIAVLVGLPSGFQFAKIDSDLAILNKLSLNKAAFAYSQVSYKDAEWSLDVDSGVNFLAIVNATGEVGGLLKRVGQNMNQIKVSGTINPAITGSKFIVGLGAGVTLGVNGKLGEAAGLFLVMNIIETAPKVPGLSIAIQAGLSINLPGQVNPIGLYGEFKYTPPTLLTLAGWMTKGSFYGAPAFGINGLALGEFGISAGMDLAETAATAGLIPISEFGLGGTIKFGSVIISATGSINYSTNPDLVMVGEAQNLYLKDLVSFGADIIDRAGKIIGKKAEINNLADNLPTIGFKKINIYIVPKDTTFLNVTYKKGIEVAIIMDIINTSVGCGVRVEETGLKGAGFIKGLAIGPVKIVAGPSAKPGTPADQATLLLELDAATLLARLYIDGGIIIDVMDGIKGGSTIDLSTEGIICHLTSKIFTNFEAELKVTGKGALSPSAVAAAAKKPQGNLQDTANFSIYAKLTTDACTLLGNLIQKSATEFMQNKKKVDQFKEESKKNIQTLSKQKADLEKQIADRNAQINKIYAESQKRINEEQAKLASLQKKSDALDAAKAQCKKGDFSACADVVTKGADWASSQAAYYATKAALEAAKALQIKNPAITSLTTEVSGLQTALKGIEASMAVGPTGVDIVAAAGDWGVQTISDLGNVVGQILVSGINIQRAEFDANLADIKQGKLPMVAISGIIAGKKIDTKLQINFKDMQATLISLAQALKGIVAP